MTTYNYKIVTLSVAIIVEKNFEGIFFITYYFEANSSINYLNVVVNIFYNFTYDYQKNIYVRIARSKIYNFKFRINLIN